MLFMGQDTRKSLHGHPAHRRFRVNTTRLLRDMNARQCLRVLRDKGSLSRADIARELGTTKATVGNAIRELIDSGLVSAADQANDIAHVGRPGANVRLDPERGWCSSYREIHLGQGDERMAKGRMGETANGRCIWNGG